MKTLPTVGERLRYVTIDLACAGEPHADRPIRSRKPEVQIYQAVVVYGYQLAEVGDELGLHYSTVNWIVGGRRRLVSKVKV